MEETSVSSKNKKRYNRLLALNLIVILTTLSFILFLVPLFETIFAIGFRIPDLTQWLFDSSRFLRAHTWIVAILVLVGLFFSYRALRKKTQPTGASYGGLLITLVVFTCIATLAVLSMFMPTLRISALVLELPTHSKPQQGRAITLLARLYFSTAFRGEHFTNLDTPAFDFTNCILIDMILRSDFHREISQDRPLFPLAFGGSPYQPAPLQDVVRCLKILCSSDNPRTCGFWFAGASYSLTCTFRDNSDDFATITITPDPAP